MSIYQLKTDIVNKITEKYKGKSEDPNLVSAVRSDTTALLTNAQKNGIIRTFENVYVRKTSRGTVQIRVRLYPNFLGALVKLDFEVGI